MAPQVRPFPANLLKFNAYIKVTDSLESAMDVVRKKRLAYGEPCVATYKVEDKKAPSGYSLHVLFGIGSMKPDDPYFFGLYDSGSGIVSIDQVMPELQEIIDEFYGKELTYIRYSVSEPSNLTDKFSGGSITLGEASMKHVIDQIKENSDSLATSGAIYAFVVSLIRALESEINSKKFELDQKIERLDSSLSQTIIKVGGLSERVDDLSEDVSVLRYTVGKMDPDSYITDVVSDSSAIHIVVGSNKAHIGLNLESEFADNIRRNADGKMSIFWNSYEQ